MLKQETLNKTNKEISILIEQLEKIKTNHFKIKTDLTLFLEQLTNLSNRNDLNETIDILCSICILALERDKDIILTDNLYPKKDLAKDIYLFIKEIILNLKINDYKQILFITLCVILCLGYEPLKCLKEHIRELISKSNDYKYGVYNEAEYLKELEQDIKFDNPTSNIEFEYKNNILDVIIDYGLEVKTYSLWYKANYDKCKIYKK